MRGVKPRIFSLLPEGLAVGALVLGGVVLVGAHQDPVQGAVVVRPAVMGALLHGAGNAGIGLGAAAGMAVVAVLVHGIASFDFEI
jgi:hypothetical protein